MPPSGNRQDAEKRFWKDVEKLLEQDLGHGQAHREVKRFRRIARARDLGETIYNKGEKKTAEMVKSLIKSGVPYPDAPS